VQSTKLSPYTTLFRSYTVEKMTTKHPYDLLVNENVKVDIKVGRVHYHFGSKAHTFRLAKKYSTCDIYICFALDKDSNTENIFIRSEEHTSELQSRFDL